MSNIKILIFKNRRYEYENKEVAHDICADIHCKFRNGTE
jgi:hypothetical protein